MDERSERDRERDRQEYFALVDSVLNSAETVEELRKLTEDQVKARHAEAVRLASITGARDDKAHVLNYARSYTDELARREAVRQGERMEALTRSLNRLTWWIVVLTVVIAIATIFGVAPTVWTLLSGA
jgi:CHASE3 domain sensor protein